MKWLLVFALFSFNAMASDYNCRAGMIKLELKTDDLMSTLIVRDIQSGEYYYNGVVSDIIDRDGRTDLLFETRSFNYLQLQFKSKDIKNEADKLYGFIRGWYGAGLLDDSITCFKKEPLI